MKQPCGDDNAARQLRHQGLCRRDWVAVRLEGRHGRADDAACDGLGVHDSRPRSTLTGQMTGMITVQTRGIATNKFATGAKRILALLRLPRQTD